MLCLGLSVCLFAGSVRSESARIVFYLPFDEDGVARTPAHEIEAVAGARLTLDTSQSVTVEQLAKGPVFIEEEEGKITSAEDSRIEWVPGLNGQAAQLKVPLKYYFPVLRTMEEGTIALWYRDCSAGVDYHTIPALLTTTYDKFTKADRTVLPAWWNFEPYTAPDYRNAVKWVMTDGARGTITPLTDEPAWHFWALRWDRSTGLLQAIDDAAVRAPRGYDKLLNIILYSYPAYSPTEWSPEIKQADEFSLDEGIGQEALKTVFNDKLILARHCEVTVDEVAVWDKALSVSELKQAFERGRAGQEVWPKSAKPIPKRKRNEGLDLTGLPTERPPLPSQVQWGDEGAYIQKTPTVRSICLNGYWRYQPAGTRLAAPEPTKPWRYVRLPGVWGRPPDASAGVGYPRMYDAAFTALDAKAWPWEGQALESFGAHWFERDVPVPAAPSGTRYFLRFTRADPEVTSLDFYWEGHFAGRVHTYGQGYVDVTPWVKPGQWNRVHLAVESKASLLFDLFLESQALYEVSVHDVYLIPDWRNKSITAQFEIHNHTKEEQAFEYNVEFFEWKGGKPAHALAGKSISIVPGRTLTELTGKWEQPHGWSIYDPFLYTAQVLINDKDRNGRLRHRSLPVRFGYRDLWTENGWYYLNGSKLHNRGVGQPCGSMGYTELVDFGQMKLTAANYYLTQKSFNSFWHRWLNRYGIDAILDMADQIGGFGGFKLAGGGNLFQGRPESMQCALTFARWLRNHPSLANYTIRQNRNAKEPHTEEEYNQVWEAYVAPLKQMHPTALCHDMWVPSGSDMWPVVGKHSYGLALQSREELGQSGLPTGAHVSPVVRRHGKIPARYNAEFGWPQISRNAFDATGDFKKSLWEKKSQVMEELGAIYFGDEAYRQGATQTNGIGGSGVSFDWDYVKAIQTVGRPYTVDHDILWSPIFTRLRMLFVDRNIPAWRWYGLGYWEHTEAGSYGGHNRPAGVPPEAPARKETYIGTRRPGIYFDDEPKQQPDFETIRRSVGLSQVGEIVKKHQGPIVAWIFGHPDVARKDHAFYAGEPIKKQVAVMNEHPWPVDVTLRWQAEERDTTNVIAHGQFQAAFQTGDQQLFPFEFTAPPVTEKRHYRMALKTLYDGKIAHDHEFLFEVFPRPERSVVRGKIALIDSGGTGAMLAKAGIACDLLTAPTDLAGYDLLMVGRRCDHPKVRELLRQMEIHRHIERGLNVLFFEQEGEVLKRPEPDPWPKLMYATRGDCPELVSFGLRQDRRSARDVFMRHPHHPLFEGLDHADMRNWRGESDLIKAWTPESWFQFVGGRTFREPNMSNLGDVATYVFEKPQGGNFVSLLDAQFDLLYSALLEERRGKGKVIFCQLNVTNRYGIDPVATLLADRLIAYALRQESGPDGKAALLANRAWDKVMEHLPFTFERINGESSASMRGDIRLLAVGLGQPRIEEFDDQNRFIGTEAESAVGVDPKVKAKKELDEAIEKTMEALTEPSSADGGPILDVPTDKKAKAAKAVESVKGKGPEKDLAYTWLTQHKGEIEAFVKKGGIVWVMPVAGWKDLSWLPFEVKWVKTNVYAVAPKGFFRKTSAIGPADLYWRRALELDLPSGLPENSLATEPAVLARIPWGQGEFILCQVHPKMIYGTWAESKLTRVLSSVLLEAGVRDRLDLDLTRGGYQDGAFPYFCCTLYFDPFMSRHW